MNGHRYSTDWFHINRSRGSRLVPFWFDTFPCNRNRYLTMSRWIPLHQSSLKDSGGSFRVPSGLWVGIVGVGWRMGGVRVGLVLDEWTRPKKVVERVTRHINRHYLSIGYHRSLVCILWTSSLPPFVQSLVRFQSLTLFCISRQMRRSGPKVVIPTYYTYFFPKMEQKFWKIPMSPRGKLQSPIRRTELR